MTTAISHPSVRVHLPGRDQHRSVEDNIQSIDPMRGQPLLRLHMAWLVHFNLAKGSGSKHQAWPGGYRDHLTQMLNMGYRIHNDLLALYGRPPFRWDSVVVGIYLHDCEKLWSHVPEKLRLDPAPDKEAWIEEQNATYGLGLTDEERNAIRFAHGEPDRLYNKTERLLGRVGAVVHACDILSARCTFDLDLETPFKESSK